VWNRWQEEKQHQGEQSAVKPKACFSIEPTQSTESQSQSGQSGCFGQQSWWGGKLPLLSVLCENPRNPN